MALIPQPLLPNWEKGSRIQSPSPKLGEGFRVRAYASGMLPLRSLCWVSRCEVVFVNLKGLQAQPNLRSPAPTQTPYCYPPLALISGHYLG